MKKNCFLLLMMSVLAFLPFSLRGELVLKVGAGFSGPAQIDPTGGVDWHWSVLEGLFVAQESNNATFSTKGGFTFEGGIEYFFTPNVGLSLNASFLNPKVDVFNQYQLNSEFLGSEYLVNRDWESSNEIKIVPISLNFVYRIDLGKSLNANIILGPTLFITNTELYGTMGYTAFYDDDIDLFHIDLYHESTSVSFGFDIGAGIDLKLTPNIAFYCEGAYYICPSIAKSWQYNSGVYEGELGLLIFNVEDDSIDIGDYGFEIKPSFFKFTAGIKIALGEN